VLLGRMSVCKVVRMQAGLSTVHTGDGSPPPYRQFVHRLSTYLSMVCEYTGGGFTAPESRPGDSGRHRTSGCGQAASRCLHQPTREGVAQRVWTLGKGQASAQGGLRAMGGAVGVKPRGTVAGDMAGSALAIAGTRSVGVGTGRSPGGDADRGG
jgi:hypothetical protein